MHYDQHNTMHLCFCFVLFFGVFTEYTQVGCFGIDSGPLMQSLENTDPILGGSYHARADAVIKCLNAARRIGNKIFAFKNGGECLTLSVSDLDVSKIYEESNDCTDSKGSASAMNIYVIKSKIFHHNYCLRLRHCLYE